MKMRQGFAGLVLLLSTAAQAQLYVGASASALSLNPNKGDWNAGAGYTSSYQETDNGYKLLAGYRLTPHFSIEGGYTQLGTYKARIVDNANAANTGNASVKAESWNLFGVGGVAASDALQLFGKVGLSINKAEMGFFRTGAAPFNAVDAASSTRTSLAWGLGASYAFTKGLSLRAEYEEFGEVGDTNNGFTLTGKTSNSRPTMWSIGVQFGF